jgi:catechol 2,3-dioxygenase-like lactoylglutathione lyase family enzyme
MFARPQINLYVADVEASATFYRTGFGFVETFRTPAAGRPEHVELRLDGFTLGLAAIEAARRVHGIPAGAAPAGAELVVWSDDVDRACADLVAAGAAPLSAPHDFLGALRAAWIADPDGHPIQIVMRRPAPVPSS